ncbi:hypothetical protein AVEN_165008-1 [Araneus ventricosus]|uniref:Uncharacterized protein n=1 Tax=Araneus ventricosus TaxID=182803 RepID=A0A4Y2LVF6_ARAVE|nr:hypothetical protein AVEN_165008-1 [Araneus ventricosus]
MIAFSANNPQNPSNKSIDNSLQNVLKVIFLINLGKFHSQIEVNVPEHSYGNMSEVCEFSSKNIPCCLDGKVRLPNLIEAPDLFKGLLCRNSQEAKKISTADSRI